MPCKKILIDFERMRYPHTGLYHFCSQLGKALLKQIEPSSERIYLYLPREEQQMFKRSLFTPVHHSSFHKFYMPSKNQFDIWHSIYQGTNYLPNRIKSPLILTIHDLNFMHDCSLSASKKKDELRKLQVKTEQANYLTVISEFTLKEVKTYLNIGNIPVKVIHNGCNFTKQTTITPPSYVPSVNFLFTIGTVVPKKNFHVLPALLAKNDLFLVIAGINHDVAYRQKIEEEAKKWRVQDRIIFTGTISEEEKSWYYQHCTAFVFPSLAEGFGLPVIEAMHFGKPVFLSSLASLPEIGGNVANYFLHFEPQHMQTVLEKGLHEYSSTRHSAPIRQRAGLFSWEKAAQSYRNVYQSFF